MVNEQLLHYIEKELAKDFAREQISEMLLKSGYTSEDIDDCFEQLATHDTTAPIPREIPPDAEAPVSSPLQRPRSMIAIVGLVILVVILSYGVMRLIPDSDTGNNETTAPNSTVVPPATHRSLSADERQALLTVMVTDCTENYAPYADEVCLSLATDDIKSCGSDTGCADDVYLVRAYADTDTSVCEKIQNERYRAGCHAVLEKQESQCAQLDSDNRLYCEAALQLDEKKCGRISDGELKDECSGMLLLFRAVSQDDINGCAPITSMDIKNRCYGFITRDKTYCSNKRNCEDHAYHELALITADISLCNSIADAQKRENCTREAPQ